MASAPQLAMPVASFPLHVSVSATIAKNLMDLIKKGLGAYKGSMRSPRPRPLRGRGAAAEEWQDWCPVAI
jgi:hypothetical protein